MKKIFNEFKAFISRGNIVDMAVGVIIGSAFTAIVNALVNNIFMPLISSITGNGIDNLVTIIPWATKLSDVTASDFDPGKAIVFNGRYYDKLSYINWGLFLQAIINFLLIAVVLFSIVKIINTLRGEGEKAKVRAIERAKKNKAKRDAKRRKKGLPVEEEVVETPVEEEVKEEVKPDPSIVLLTEIRDLLKEKSEDK
ncbi:MAG: large conductance mechanosensitive channel protein MscL [Bacilli bacterium]